MQHRTGVEARSIVERVEEKAGRWMAKVENPADRRDQDKYDDHAKGRRHSGIDASGCLDAVAVEHSEEKGEEDRPRDVRNLGHKVDGGAAAPDYTDQRVDDVVEYQAPARDVAEARVNLFADVEERRATMWIHASHAAVAHRGKQHGHHRQQDDGDHMASRLFVEHAEDRHGRGGLNENDAVEDQIPETQCA